MYIHTKIRNNYYRNSIEHVHCVSGIELDELVYREFLKKRTRNAITGVYLLYYK